MVYRAIGLMSGSSLDGLDLAFVSFEEIRGKWNYDLRHTKCVLYSKEWKERLKGAANLTAREFVQLDQDLGQYFGNAVKAFIYENQLDHQTQMIVSHGHTIFHNPASKLTTQIGNGAHIAAINSINVIDQLRAMDVALGGQGAPLVPLGEQLLFPDDQYFLNIGGIANISIHEQDNWKAFDICPANQLLNYLAGQNNMDYDKDGQLAASGNLNTPFLTRLNALPYFSAPVPKSLSNQYFQDTIIPMLRQTDISLPDLLRTATEHIAMQIAYSLNEHAKRHPNDPGRLLVTGGGALNQFLIKRLSHILHSYNIEVLVPETSIVEYKEALIMALLGVLRWREENTVLENTGASRPSIGGAVWIGQSY